MESDNALYKGYLILPANGKILLKKSRQKKYCILFKSSKFGRERLEIYDSIENIRNAQPKTIITLENVIKITERNPTTFSILTKSADYEFGTESKEALDEWIEAIQAVAFPDEVSKITSIEEDNDLYCSSGEGVFNVKLLHSQASQRCGLETKNYTLLLTSTAIQLRNIPDSKVLFTWPYCYIRRYGYKSGKFTFEAGRKCESGEGTFYLEHSNQQEIFRCLASKMKSMKKLLGGESTASLLDCTEPQLQAALSMEARSRSPLPPSAISPLTTLTESDFFLSNSTSSASSQKSLLSQHSVTSITDIDRPKIIPQKPPRKQPLKVTTNIIQRNTVEQPYYEPIDKYDRVEYRSDAWKTLGIDDIRHTEQVNVNDDDDEQEYVSWGTIKKPSSPHQQVAPFVIAEQKYDSNDYDKLNHFGSNAKLNLSYKQVFPVPLAATTTPSVPSFNHYDEVQVMERVRPADDSHLGYGLVRKEVGKDGLVEHSSGSSRKGSRDDGVSHKFCNDAPYAVISKPKRV